jgi:predicted DCC family thiol-disulfide oxidoreductase YuxK
MATRNLQPVHGESAVDRKQLFSPGVEVVALYDGDCALCRSSVDWLRTRDTNHRIFPVALQTPGVLRTFHLTRAQAEGEMHAYDRNGEHRSGADAVLWAVSLLPRFSTLRPLYKLPGAMPIARFVYRQIARRRGLTACDGAGCRLQ